MPKTLMTYAQTNLKKVQGDENLDTAIDDLSLHLFSDMRPYDSHELYITTVMKPNRDNDFSQSRARELEGLIDRHTFKVVDLTKITKGAQIYGSRFVDSLKNVNGKNV